MQKVFFIDWVKAYDAGTQSVGGKGWNLARLVRYGFKVPPGGVLTSKAYQQFIEFNNLQNNLAEITDRVSITKLGEAVTRNKLAQLRDSILQRIPYQ